MNGWLLLTPMWFLGIETAVLVGQYQTKKDCYVAAMELREDRPFRPLVCVEGSELKKGEVLLVPMEVE